MAFHLPEPILQLSTFLKTLPGVGERTAERLSLSILKWPQEKQESMAELIAHLKELVTPCPICGCLASEKNLCSICNDLRRDHQVICVLEEPQQIPSIENAGIYHGLYHILNGKIAPLEGKNPDSLNIPSLLKRVQDMNIKEVILAISLDIEGLATANYLTTLLKEQREDLIISRLSQGLPAGAEIAYADSATLAIALNKRQKTE